MNVAFARRLTVASTVVIGGGFVTIVILSALLALSMYVSELNRDVNDTMSDVRTALTTPRGEPSDARVAGRLLTSRLFSERMRIEVLDQHRRVDIARRGASRSYTFTEAARNDVSHEFPPNTLASRSLLALATLLGLQAKRAELGPLLFVVRVQEAALAHAALRFLPLVALALIGAVGLSFAFARMLVLQALRPLNDVTRALERLAAGDLRPPMILAHGEHQLRDLTRAYNGAIGRVQSAFDERDDAHAAMRQFIADAGHQLRTPLTVVRGFIGILLRGALHDASDYTRILTSMNQQCISLGSSIDKLILLDDWERDGLRAAAELVDVSQLVEDVVTPIAEASPTARITLDVAPGALARIDPIGCAHALTNLIDNALKYAPRSAIAVTLVHGDPTIQIDVVDDGPGMTADEVAHVFDRFHRGPLRRDVTGSGLGLPIARRAIERANGTLTLASEPQHGARFTIRLPRAQHVAPVPAEDFARSL